MDVFHKNRYNDDKHHNLYIYNKLPLCNMSPPLKRQCAETV